MRHRPSDKHDINHYSVGQIYQRMWPLVRPHRWRLLFVSGLITLSGVLMATMPMFGKYVFDEAIPAGRLDLAVKAMALFLALQLARLVLGYAGQKIIVREQEQVVFGLRAMSFRHVQRLCLRFHGRHPTGFLHDRVFIQGICRIGMIITYVFDQLSVQVAGLVFALAMCLYLNVTMTLVVLLGAVAYVAVARRMGPRVRQRHIECSDAHNAVCSYIMDKLQGNKTIQAHALEERVDEEFDENVWGVQEKYIRARTEGIRLSLVTQIVSVALTALTYVVGAYYAISLGDGKLGTLVAFLGYQGQLIGVIGALVAVYGEIAAARVGFDQFFTVMDTRTTVPDAGQTPLPQRLPGLVEFRNVTFAYDDKPVLRDVSFTVQPGQSVALVGRSGAGKSTLANLLLRFYDPNAGQVLVDGVPIPDYPLRPYRSRLGVVLQDPFLFDDTIAGNVRCVKPEATDEEVWRALDLACAKDFVLGFPEGLARPVGERGGGLSGGQRQRIAIARALLMDPDVLILDEPTAALDNESEAVIQHALGALFAGRTSFVIAHRLSTIRHVDRILVFDAGRLVEEGPYDALLARRGLFHHLHHVVTSTSTRPLKMDEAGFA